MSYFKQPRNKSSTDSFENPEHWRELNSTWFCKLCGNAQGWKLADALKHEKKTKHKERCSKQSASSSSASAAVHGSSAPSASSQMPSNLPRVPHFNGPGDMLDAITSAFQARVNTAFNEDDVDGGNDADASFHDDIMHTSEDETGTTPEASQHTHQTTQDLRAAQLLAKDLFRRIHRDDPDIDFSSDDEDPEHESDAEEQVDEDITVNGKTAGRRNMKRRAEGENEEDNPWFPWANQQVGGITIEGCCSLLQECSLDVLTHLRRSTLSREQMNLVIWLAMFNGAENMPSERQMRDSDKLLQQLCGIETIDYIGAMGNRFSVNSLAGMLAQEWANPHVRPHIRDLPERCGGKNISEAWQTEQWNEHLPLHLATPMIRCSAGDFFVFEPALLTTGEICMPMRWYTKSQSLRPGEPVVTQRWAEAWRMIPIGGNTEDGSTREGWYVHEYDTMHVSEDTLLLPLPAFSEQYKQHGNIPSPTLILGSLCSAADAAASRVAPWTRTDPLVGNRWRVLADGSLVKAAPCWGYGDDTSGNQSKKWNKHVSFLFTLAGLPREQAQKEFNMHFLTTSNTAETMEMLDAVVSQFEECQESGIWAYDCVDGEIVLLIPSLFAILGDNPMQSEFCCHIGMRGKFFCRVCWVEGKARKATAGDDSDGDGASSDGGSVASQESGTSQHSQPGATRRRKVTESLSALIDRVKRFTKLGVPRTKAQSVEQLAEIRAAAFQGKNAQQEFKKRKTQFGLKDTFFEQFADRLFRSLKGKRSRVERERLTSAFKSALPPELLGPLWRLAELDPHHDTPVEILHVVLLGILKYFWRDAVNNQCKSKAKREELIARLNSFDVSGLGISPLRGETLVKYAGSLVGRDFRAVAQAAPFVLHGMVDDDCYQAWVHLSQLVPQIWQPKIDDLDKYIAHLTVSIDNFLAATAKWTPQWFNKPKFHILLHLPAHIRRFGPAILFATEGFESFNAVIRFKSLHSNRQAPSRDIARAFAQGDRVRHLLSGGYFFRRTVAQHPAPITPIDLSKPYSARERAYTAVKPQLSAASSLARAGTAARSLSSLHPIVRRFLGLPEEDVDTTGSIVPFSAVSAAGTELAATASFRHSAPQLTALAPHSLVRTCRSIQIANGDAVQVGSWVAYRSLVASSPASPPMLSSGTQRTNTSPMQQVLLGYVEEILDLKSTSVASKPDRRLLLHTSPHRPSHNSTTYQMPMLPPRTLRTLVSWEALLCTVNVQHNCADNSCSAKGTRTIQQERVATARTIRVISHSEDDDWVLNLAQMRDANILRSFAIHQLPYDLNRAIEAGAVAFSDRQKKAAVTTSGAGSQSAVATEHTAAGARSGPQISSASPVVPSLLRQATSSAGRSVLALNVTGDNVVPSPAVHIRRASPQRSHQTYSLFHPHSLQDSTTLLQPPIVPSNAPVNQDQHENWRTRGHDDF